MRPYKMKHTPTGLYFQPHKHRGSHLSKNGKIYQTKVNGWSSQKSGNHKFFWISCEKDSLIHRLTKDIIDWKVGYSNQLNGSTNFEDWVIEEI